MRMKRLDLWEKKFVALHQDNASANILFSIKEFLADKHNPILKHPPYSSDLAPCVFYLFSKLKISLKRTQFQILEEA